MYIPPQFAETEPTAIRALVEAFSLATLVANTQAGLVANHIPILMVSDQKLIGHVAHNNNLHEILVEGAEVLAIFNGDDAYISPNWYPGKAKHHKHVPTWNYEVVHIHGTIRFRHDDKSKRAVVGRLTKHHESQVNGDAAWKMADAPADYMQTMLDAIVAFEITVTQVLGKSKFSQNRDAHDLNSVVNTLTDNGNPRIAKKMTKQT